MATNAIIYGSAGSPNTLIVSSANCIAYGPGGLYYISSGAPNLWVHNNYWIFGGDNGTAIHTYAITSSAKVYVMAVRLSYVRYSGNDCYYAYGAQHSLATAYNSTIRASGQGVISASIGCSGVVSGRYSNISDFAYSWNHSKTVNETTWNNASVLHIGGESVQMYATPDAHCRVKRWLRNGSTLSLTDPTSWIHTLPSSDFELVCEFEQYEWPLTVKNTNTSAGHITGGVTSSWTEASKNVVVKAVCDNSTDYRFLGWYKGYGDNLDASACTTLVTTNADLTIVTESRAVTYVAKWVSRKTTLNISKSGEGVFDVYVNNSKVATGVETYSNANARDGWAVRVVASPASMYYFSHWLTPGGTSVYNVDTSYALEAKETNSFVANFVQKTIAATQVEFSYSDSSTTSNGKVEYSGDLVSSGSLTTNGSVNTYVETACGFVASSTNKLYAFQKWQYKVGSAYYDVVAGSLPNWIQAVDGANVAVYIKGANASDTHVLRAVFRKLTTYSVATPVIEGSHPILETLASASGSGCSVLQSPTTPDEGTNKWLEGTTFEYRATAGAKWEASYIEVVMGGEVHKYDGATASVTLTGTITSVKAVFLARKYKVSVATDSASTNAGTVSFEYTNISGTKVETAHEAEVYVDTDVTIKATPYGSNAGFYDWSLNGTIASNFSATQTVKITGTSAFVARFAVDVRVTLIGQFTSGDTVYSLGRVQFDYTVNGVPTSSLVTLGSDVCPRLLCGSTFSLKATPLKDESGNRYEGFFEGWQSNRSGDFAPVVGWSDEVNDVIVDIAMTYRAMFSQNNRWPRLRLENPTDGDFCAFTLSGVRVERIQELADKSIVELKDNNEWFCDRFSVVQVRVNKYNSATRFLRWQEYDYETKNLINDSYSTDQDISLFMTGDTFLKPVFWIGTSILAEASLVSSVDATMGDVSIEGERLEETNEITSGKFAQGDEVTFVASPRNGYKFVGWFNDRGGSSQIPNAGARYTVAISGTTVLYAKFEQDENAIYTFGTSNNAKTYRWKSKSVESAVPITFSSAKVDADGYEDLELTLHRRRGASSRKDEEMYRIQNSNSRRLRGGFTDRVFELELNGHTSVHSVVVATSVTALGGTS